MVDIPGDVVCVGVVESGQVVDWSPGSPEPQPAEWIDEVVFWDILRVSKKRRVPFISKLDIHAQTRLGARECTRILAKWGALEESLANGRAENAAEAMRPLINLCADSSGRSELIIEGP